MSSSTSAQPPNLVIGMSGLVKGIPDFCERDADCLHVDAGTTLTLSGIVTASTIGIHGTVVATDGLRLNVGTLLIYPDGELILGTPNVPLKDVVITIINQPLDLTTDPETIGTGIICLGSCKIAGIPITSFVRLASEVEAGETVLQLESIPSGWTIGQRLILPDSRQLTSVETTDNGGTTQTQRIVNQSEVVQIANIVGQVITLVAPTQFSHLGARLPDNTLKLLPHIGNLSRSITIRSADPLGTRGHIFFSQMADVDVQNVALVDLGRTRAVDVLDDTKFDVLGNVVHIGTNQRGRYPLHFHHVAGTCTAKPYQYKITGSVIESSLKWGITIHNTHFGLIQDNVIYNVGGAGIVTEDGSETGNVFDHNLVVHVPGTLTLAADELTYDPQGRNSAGFWFRGPANRVTNNVVADVREGFGWYTGAAEVGPNGPAAIVNVPNAPCVDTMNPASVTPTPIFRRPMGVIDRNEVYSTSGFGMAFWWEPAVQMGSPAITNTTFWHNPGFSIFYRYADIAMDGTTIINKNGVGIAVAQGNDASPLGAGPGLSEQRHADFRGIGEVYEKIGQLALAPLWRWSDSIFQSLDGFPLNNLGEALTTGLDDNNQQVSRMEWFNTTWLSMPGKPLKTFQLTYFNRGSIAGLEGIRRLDLLVQGYQDDPSTKFQLYFPEQTASSPAPPPDGPALGRMTGCPLPNLTNQQCWDQFGVATLMAIAPSNVTTRPEIMGLIDTNVMPIPIPTPRPPIPPSPIPQPTNLPPYGYLDSVANGLVIGWAYDPDISGMSTSVRILVDNVLVSTVNANVPRPDVNIIIQIPGNHGYSYQLPPIYLDGQSHLVIVELEDASLDPTLRVPAIGSPMTFTSATPTAPTQPAVPDIAILLHWDGTKYIATVQ